MWPFSCSILHQLATSLFYFRSDSWKSIWTGLFFQEGHKNHTFLASLWVYSLWSGIFSWSDKAEPLHCMDDEVWRALGRQPDITNMSSPQSHCSHLDTNVLYFSKSCSWVWHHSSMQRICLQPSDQMTSLTFLSLVSLLDITMHLQRFSDKCIYVSALILKATQCPCNAIFPRLFHLCFWMAANKSHVFFSEIQL